MADKDVDEQFAAIMAHWHEDALGLDPFGDPSRTEDDDSSGEHGDGSSPGSGPDGPGEPGAPRSGSDAALDAELDADLARLGLDDGDLDRLEAREQGADDGDATPPPDPASPTDRLDRSGPETPATLPVALPGRRVSPRPRRDEAPPPAPVEESARGAGSGWRQHDAPDVEEHFVPPPPAPLPSADDKHFWLMMVGLIGGPLLFLYLMLFDRDGHGWLMIAGIAMTIGGFVLLVLRQPLQRDEDDDGIRL